MRGFAPEVAIKSPSGHDVAVDNQAFLIHLMGKELGYFEES